MRFIIIDTYYPNFLKSFRRKYPDLYRQSYNKQLQLLLKQSFGTADFYSFNLKKLGYWAEDIIANDEILQRQWARENGITVPSSNFLSKIQMIPFFHKFLGRPRWVQEIVLAQIKKAKPDIVYLQDLSILNPGTLREVKKYCRLLVGQIACPLSAKKNLLEFDLVITSFPHYVDKFRKMGINSEYLPLAFEPRILKKINGQKRIYDVTFIGSFTPFHQRGTKILDEVARKIPINIWSQGLIYLLPNSPLQRYFHGEVWGLSMYEVLAQSKIVINRHISVARDYANNMRLYESTGMGAMLISDEKKNLHELFEISKEVVTYKDSLDLIDKIKYYLTQEDKRKKLAAAGQKRTLKEHTYRKRMEELINILKKYL